MTRTVVYRPRARYNEGDKPIVIDQVMYGISVGVSATNKIGLSRNILADVGLGGVVVYRTRTPRPKGWYGNGLSVSTDFLPNVGTGVNIPGVVRSNKPIGRRLSIFPFGTLRTNGWFIRLVPYEDDVALAFVTSSGDRIKNGYVLRISPTNITSFMDINPGIPITKSPNGACPVRISTI